MKIEDSLQIKKLNDYILYLNHVNENLAAEVSRKNEQFQIQTSENEINTSRFLSYIEDQAKTIENNSNEITDLRCKNSRLFADYKNALNEISALQAVVSQKQTIIEGWLNRKLHKKTQKICRQSVLVEEMEQDRILLQITVRKQLSEIQQMKTQILELEYIIKTLKGKIKLNSEINKSYSNLSRNFENTGLMTLAKWCDFKKKKPLVKVLGQGSQKAKTNIDFDNEHESASEEFPESMLSVFRRETEDKNGQFFTDDELVEPKEYLKSLDFFNAPIVEVAEESPEKYIGKSSFSANSYKPQRLESKKPPEIISLKADKSESQSTDKKDPNQVGTTEKYQMVGARLIRFQQDLAKEFLIKTKSLILAILYFVAKIGAIIALRKKKE